MNKLQLLRLLRQHVKLSEKRSAIYDQNRFAKFFIYLGGMFVIAYIMFLSIMLALIANDSETTTPYEFFFCIAPFVLVLDFFARFLTQQTPVQLVKPYTLLPIPKYACIECFIISSIITPNNFIWLALSVPYAIMTILFSEGFFVALSVVIAFQLLVIVNSQWYMLARTLINVSIKWWLLPIAVYGALFSPLFLELSDEWFDVAKAFGEGVSFWNPLFYIAILAVLAAFYEVNKRIQFSVKTSESRNAEEKNLKNVSEFKMFDRYGEAGEYLKLEIKSMMRNKNLRKSFIMTILLVVLLSAVISFTDAYDSDYMRSFWLVYNFELYGAMTLIKIMCAEGNYIDGLMIRRENILQLLKAKYYFYCAVLLVPFVLMLPTLFMGKYTLLMLVSILAFTAGPVYCLLMQMAIYNRQAMPLNAKFTSRGAIENNYVQVIVELVAFFAPTILISVLHAFFSATVTFSVLLVIGLAFVLTHDMWLRNIYTRFMKKRYVNMEGFRSSR
ncbi:MAG: DUF5687 family protein [Prevotellaceae bacterium]|nr:DUF5687 family protein [Prevotellaceae bacterium]